VYNSCHWPSLKAEWEITSCRAWAGQHAHPSHKHCKPCAKHAHASPSRGRTCVHDFHLVEFSHQYQSSYFTFLRSYLFLHFLFYIHVYIHVHGSTFFVDFVLLPSLQLFHLLVLPPIDRYFNGYWVYRCRWINCINCSSSNVSLPRFWWLRKRLTFLHNTTNFCCTSAILMPTFSLQLSNQPHQFGSRRVFSSVLASCVPNAWNFCF